jgi:four helix bundle protein
VVEESDESEYWLEVSHNTNLSTDMKELLRLLKEANEISRIMTKAKNSSYAK